MKYFVILLITLSASVISPTPNLRGTVIWNVGQGQWVTSADGDTCYHFDMGGEFFPWKRLRDLCGTRKNKVLLSHWDWDHIGALANRRLRKVLPDLCTLLRQVVKAVKVRKHYLLDIRDVQRRLKELMFGNRLFRKLQMKPVRCFLITGFYCLGIPR